MSAYQIIASWSRGNTLHSEVQGTFSADSPSATLDAYARSLGHANLDALRASPGDGAHLSARRAGDEQRP